MSMLQLPSPFFTTSNLPGLMDLTFQVSMQYFSLQHQTLLPPPVTYIIGCYFFALAPSLHSFWNYLSTDLQEHIGHLLTGEVNLSVSKESPIFLPFHTVHGVLKARILKWSPIPFSSGPCFVRILHHDPSILGGPTWHGL